MEKLVKKSSLIIVLVCLCAGMAYAGLKPDVKNFGLVIDQDQYLQETVSDFVKYWEMVFPDSSIKVCESAQKCDADFVFYFGENPLIKKDELGPLSVDGYIIRSGAKGLAIQGRTLDGTGFGVMGLIRDLGVRFYLPTELFTYIPAADKVNLDLTAYNKTVEPDFLPRYFSGIVGDAGTWYRRNRGDKWRIEMPNLGFNHNLYTIFTRDVAKEHPEYFPTVDGKRIFPSESGQNINPDICNPDVIKFATQAAIDYFTKNPAAMTFSLSMNDTSEFGDSPFCEGIEPKINRTWRGGKVTSDRYFNFASTAAREIDKLFPGRQIGVLAYLSNELPPLSLKPMPSNLVICLTQDTSQHFDVNYRDVDRDVILQWSLRGVKISKYDYYGLGWVTPRYFPHIIADDLVFTHLAGVSGRYTEAYPFWGLTGPMYYVAFNMMWDTDLEADKLLDELYGDLFPGASDQVKAFFDFLEKSWAAPRQGRWFEGLNDPVEHVSVFPPETMSQARELLDAAYSAAKDPVVLKRLDFINDALSFSQGFVTAFYGLKNVESLDPATIGSVDKIIEIVNSAYGSFAQAMQIHKEKLMPTGIYPAPYYQGTDFEKDMSKFDQSLFMSAVGLLQKAAKVFGADQVWTKAAETIVVPKLKALALAQIQKFDNLLIDSSFEITRTVRLHEIREGEPMPEVITYPWFKWTDPQNGDVKVAVDSKFKRTGASSIRLEGVGQGALLHPFEAKPGHYYYASVMAYADSLPLKDTLPAFEIEWRTGDLTKIKGHFNLVRLDKTGEWVKLELAARAPETAAYGLVLLMLDNFNTSEQVWYDDAFAADLGEVK